VAAPRDTWSCPRAQPATRTIPRVGRWGCMSQVNTAVVGPVATHSRRRRGTMFRYPRPHRCQDTPGPSPATPTAVAPLRTLLSSRARARVAAGSNILTTAHPTLVQRRARGHLTGRLSDAFLYSCRLTNEMRMTDNISLFFFISFICCSRAVS